MLLNTQARRVEPLLYGLNNHSCTIQWTEYFFQLLVEFSLQLSREGVGMFVPLFSFNFLSNVHLYIILNTSNLKSIITSCTLYYL